MIVGQSFLRSVREVVVGRGLGTVGKLALTVFLAWLAAEPISLKAYGLFGISSFAFPVVWGLACRRFFNWWDVGRLNKVSPS